MLTVPALALDSLTAANPRLDSSNSNKRHL